MADVLEPIYTYKIDEFIKEFRPRMDKNMSNFKVYRTNDSKSCRRVNHYTPEKKVWTILENKDGKKCIASGYWEVGELDYIITTVPYQGDAGDIIVNFNP